MRKRGEPCFVSEYHSECNPRRLTRAAKDCQAQVWADWVEASLPTNLLALRILGLTFGIRLLGSRSNRNLVGEMRIPVAMNLDSSESILPVGQCAAVPMPGLSSLACHPTRVATIGSTGGAGGCRASKRICQPILENNQQLYVASPTPFVLLAAQMRVKQ